ncbi:polyamine aminopropyltransferase [Clostridium intestinale]|uniref:Polyamine aminopropyltransferase n=3 Tax=Clostridium intestinale TaxID=36845 RepID=U2NPW8_9CLOT|nr:polyamine aminopropyltransferase [Clostridium intestinale]ERK31223.1 spermidine synthase [Clostridium intestinale URNW]QLY78488.1 polyamine aminopropyltransferase [Clostridium intestinale]SHI19179.1 spermidine synthase [Clostridium intestinale DSM 6191]
MELWYTENQTENVKFSMKVKEHIFTGQSDFQKIDIIDTYEFGRVLVIDGWTMVTEKDEFIYHEMITHVALGVNPNIKRALVIGGGDGGTVRELTSFKNIEEIHMVEIDPVVVEASIKYLPFTSSKLSDERVKVFYQDGLEYVKDKEDYYDIIIVDSTDPIGPGEGLFTESFYKDCFKALTKDGIMVNQCESPYYPNNAREMKRSYSKIKNIFPICEVYQYNMPTYASGHWLFGFASKKYHPLKDFKGFEFKEKLNYTKYYNEDIHRGAFALPNYVKNNLEK